MTGRGEQLRAGDRELLHNSGRDEVTQTKVAATELSPDWLLLFFEIGTM